MQLQEIVISHLNYVSVISPQAGFNAGDHVRFMALPGSQTDAIRDLSSTSNIGIPGKWVYQVDCEMIISGGK